MKINIESGTSGTFTAYGKEYSLSHFKDWFRMNYQPILSKYHVVADVYDWESVLSDASKNGIIETYIQENGKN